VSGEKNEVVAFLDGEAQAPGDGIDHLFRWLRPGAALESREIVDRHVREVRNFFPAQSGSSAAVSASETNILGLQRFPAGTDERSDRNLIHGSASLRVECPLCPVARRLATAWHSADKHVLSPWQETHSNRSRGRTSGSRELETRND
jgi:hypothetical protein